ncbi:hypothetical protein CfE428DRAFT_0410 [Chthoniobacter flavus Ellin428]|uniref:Uncharacterized protein n=1 Tax=Chthoniobacter flavus Ellin428 TaxID=497964 RepID=B4CUP7_9BACT|nr:hypothetical protein CfE428DRAFT_0410 [Chthoniobacter flavus Ellin428]TCO94698.1 hypothetical protein EV701_102167 [Chthoniobacter flavus]
MKPLSPNTTCGRGGQRELEPASELRSVTTSGHGESPTHSGIILGTLKSGAMALLCLGLLDVPQIRAAVPQHDEPGALEHYHHEFYSHSYVDPNYREDLDHPPSGELSKSKTRKPINRNTNVSIGFGGHRRHHHQR